MSDHAGNLGVHQLLRHGGAHLRVGLVVFGHQGELDRLAVDLDAGRVRLVDRETRAVLVVLAEVRDAAGERRDVADLDFLRRRSGFGGGFGLALGGRFLVAAADERDRRSNKRNAEFVVHGISRGFASRGR